MKVCPTCKSRCFDDMDTCYGCMHQFTEDDKEIEEPKENTMIENIPEYFELDSFPFIEDDDYFRTRGAHEKVEKSHNDNIVIKLEVPREVFEKCLVK